jgi:hypothetical protein
MIESLLHRRGDHARVAPEAGTAPGNKAMNGAAVRVEHASPDRTA